MNISVVGLGYVGAASAACLAGAGHCVWGVDINPREGPYHRRRQISDC
jgi:UDP-glucose 6-dehydrogenase